MFSAPAIFIPASTGLVSGLLLSIPVGPVNLTILNEGARRGFRYAALVGLGATVMEVIYCSIAYTGFAEFFTHGMVKNIMEVLSALFIIFLGWKFFTAKSVDPSQPLGGRIEEKFHPQSAFMTGFVRVLGNPGLLGGWILLATGYLAQPTLESKGACVAGIGLGTCLWFCGLSYGVSQGGKKLSSQTLLLVERGSGVGLLVFGVGYACRVAWMLARFGM